MDTFKKVMNVFGIIAASILSIFLVVSLVAVPVISAATSFFEARNIQKVLAGIDYSQMIMGEMSSGESAEISIAGNELMQQLMDTEMMEDIIQLCVDNVFAVMDGENGVEKFTAVDIQMIGEEHLDELAEILKQYVKIDNNVNLSDEFYRNTARNIMAEYAVQIAQMVPTAEDLGLSKELMSTISNLRNGTYFWIVFGVAAGLSVLILLCQVMRFKSCMWLGIDYLVAAVGALIMSFVVKILDFGFIFGGGTIGSVIMKAITGVIASEMMKGAAILALIGVVFIAIFIVGRILLKKKRTTTQVEPVAV